jgi:hypothetical protein
MFSINMGYADRILRILLGASLIGLAAAGSIGAWGYLGVVPLVTGLAARCPLYSMLGITTAGR